MHFSLFNDNRYIKFSISLFTMVILIISTAFLTEHSYAFDGGKNNSEYIIQKVDENGDPVIGATFSIEGILLWSNRPVCTYLIDNTEDPITSWSTTPENNGVVELSTEAPDKVRIIFKETVTPEGYEPAEDLVLETWVDGSTGWEGTVNGERVKTDSREPITIVNKLKKREIKISKKGEDGSYLDGAVLEISGTTVKGKVIDKITITSGKEASTASLPAGKYTLHEVTPPPGYELAEDIEFEVSMDGSVTIDGKKVDEVVMVDKSTEEKKPQLSVKKTSIVKSASPGDVIPYVITVTNKGNADADDVVVLDTMNNNLTYVSDDSNGKHDGQRVTWNVQVPAGATKTININCRINESAVGKVINNVVITNVESEYIEPSESSDQFEVVLGEAEKPVEATVDEPTNKTEHPTAADDKKDAAKDKSSKTGDPFSPLIPLIMGALSAASVAAIRRRKVR